VTRNHLSLSNYTQRNVGTHTIALYNDGKHLFYDPWFKHPTEYHSAERPWAWMPYQRYHQNQNVRLGNTRFIVNGSWRNAGDFLRITHLGHIKDQVAEVLVQGMFCGRYDAIHCLGIPPKCILYVSVLAGVIKDYILVFQPLPNEIARIVR
jgi:hypothetical protein